MPMLATSSTDLIDASIRTLFHVEPDVMASLAHGDEPVRLRRLPFTAPTTDPLDGLDVFVRRTVAASLAMRRHQGAVSLVTERQAQDAGWPTAHLANVSLMLAWGLVIAEPGLAMPLLIEADDDATGRHLVRADDRLPPLETLLAAPRRGRRIDARPRERSAVTRRDASAVQSRRLVSLDETLRAWLGLDAGTVELPADRWEPKATHRNARAAGILAWIITEALDSGSVMQDERVMAVRLKTDVDAAMAAQPGAAAANMALLLGAAINHSAGCTVHVLPAADHVAESLVEASRRIASRHGWASGYETDTVVLLELEDLAARGYVHVGRRAAEHVAARLFDDSVAAARTSPIIDATR